MNNNDKQNNNNQQQGNNNPNQQSNNNTGNHLPQYQQYIHLLQSMTNPSTSTTNTNDPFHALHSNVSFPNAMFSTTAPFQYISSVVNTPPNHSNTSTTAAVNSTSTSNNNHANVNNNNTSSSPMLSNNNMNKQQQQGTPMNGGITTTIHNSPASTTFATFPYFQLPTSIQNAPHSNNSIINNTNVMGANPNTLMMNLGNPMVTPGSLSSMLLSSLPIGTPPSHSGNNINIVNNNNNSNFKPEQQTMLLPMMSVQQQPKTPIREKEITNPLKPEDDIDSTASGDSKKKRSRSKTCKRWTEEQNKQLREAVLKYGARNWKKIAQEIGGNFTPDQCNQHWWRVLNPRILKGEWTSTEDDMLFSRVQQFGESSWIRVAEGLPGRTDIQCRHRYFQRKKEIEQGQKKKKGSSGSSTGSNNNGNNSGSTTPTNIGSNTNGNVNNNTVSSGSVSPTLSKLDKPSISPNTILQNESFNLPVAVNSNNIMANNNSFSTGGNASGSLQERLRKEDSVVIGNSNTNTTPINPEKEKLQFVNYGRKQEKYYDFVYIEKDGPLDGDIESLLIHDNTAGEASANNTTGKTPTTPPNMPMPTTSTTQVKPTNENLEMQLLCDEEDVLMDNRTTKATATGTPTNNSSSNVESTKQNVDKMEDEEEEEEEDQLFIDEPEVQTNEVGVNSQQRHIKVVVRENPYKIPPIKVEVSPQNLTTTASIAKTNSATSISDANAKPSPPTTFYLPTTTSTSPTQVAATKLVNPPPQTTAANNDSNPPLIEGNATNPSKTKKKSGSLNRMRGNINVWVPFSESEEEVLKKEILRQVKDKLLSGTDSEHIPTISQNELINYTLSLDISAIDFMEILTKYNVFFHPLRTPNILKSHYLKLKECLGDKLFEENVKPPATLYQRDNPHSWVISNRNKLEVANNGSSGGATRGRRKRNSTKQQTTTTTTTTTSPVSSGPTPVATVNARGSTTTTAPSKRGRKRKSVPSGAVPITGVASVTMASNPSPNPPPATNEKKKTKLIDNPMITTTTTKTIQPQPISTINHHFDDAMSDDEEMTNQSTVRNTNITFLLLVDGKASKQFGLKQIQPSKFTMPLSTTVQTILNKIKSDLNLEPDIELYLLDQQVTLNNKNQTLQQVLDEYNIDPDELVISYSLSTNK
ncbi:hypothetical protein ABK040_005910 [Willaertia magna]